MNAPSLGLKRASKWSLLLEYLSGGTAQGVPSVVLPANKGRTRPGEASEKETDVVL